MKSLKDIFNSEIFKDLYSQEFRKLQYDRYLGIHKKYEELYGQENFTVFSAPGRVEIGGNHTDHNNGKVLAAAVSLDAVCFASTTQDNNITLYDLQYREYINVNLDSLDKVPEEYQTVNALIRGIAAGLENKGFKTGGFRGCLHSQVLSGSGLSSSAALEVLVVKIFSEFYNKQDIDFLEAAIISQYAENIYFGKPSGLMDQTACSSGGVVYIDFGDPSNPAVKKTKNPLKKCGYTMAVVHPGGDHGGLTSYYSSIPEEMKKAASVSGAEVCSKITMAQLYKNSSEIREKFGDRVFLRAFHFLNENKRVEKQVRALNEEKIDDFLKLVNLSGNSSWKYLQNVCVPEIPEKQPLAAALAAADLFTEESGGACRIHGGGFAGTILVFIRSEKKQDFTMLMENLFGSGCVIFPEIREYGPCIVC